MKKIAFYPIGDKIQVPERHIKAYVDSFCDEFKRTDFDSKMMHLLYVSDHGYNIHAQICEFLSNHPEISEDSIKSTLANFIAQIRYGEGDRNIADYCDTAAIISERLSLESTLTLLMHEVHLRFSYIENDESVTFSQKYIRWESLDQLQRKVGDDAFVRYILNPTGFYPITDEEIKKRNLWPQLGGLYMQSYWYNEKLHMVYPDEHEKKIIADFNKDATDDYKYILGAPAEPWRGNPLTADIIILSLNPGFVPGVNDNLEKYNIRHREGAMCELRNTLDFHVQGLLYEQESYIQNHEEYDRLNANDWSKINYGDFLNDIGDYYWYRNINRLNVSRVDDFTFFRHFALVQYCAYTSIKYKDFKKGTVLPSQQLTKDLIRYIAYNRPHVQFVIMRASRKWKDLLDPDVWEMMRERLIINTNMSQALSENNLGEENFNKLLNVLK